MHTSAVVNLKGGVGKTTAVLGLADAAAQLYAARADDDSRVLVIDLDPQSNATQCLLPDFDDETNLTMNDVLAADVEGGLSEAIQPTSWARVDIAPAALELANREMEVRPTAALGLRRAMRGLSGYGLVLIDCGPSVGLLVTNALAAATSALVVTTPSRAAVRGVRRSLENVAKAAELQAGLDVAGIVVNAYDRRVTEQTYRLDELRASYGAKVWEPVIPARAVIAAAYGAGVPVREMGDQAARAVSEAFAVHAARLVEAGR